MMASSSGTYKEGVNKQAHNSVSSSYNGSSVHGEWGVPTFQHQQTISMDWTPEEQALLEEGLSKGDLYVALCVVLSVVWDLLLGCVSKLPIEIRRFDVLMQVLIHGFTVDVSFYATESNIIRYAKIAVQLKNKTVRDVALRCRWMTKKEISKRRKDDFNARKSKDRKEKYIDTTAKPSRLSIQSGPSQPSGMISNCNEENISYNDVTGATRQLLQHNVWTFKQISANLSTHQLERHGASDEENASAPEAERRASKLHPSLDKLPYPTMIEPLIIEKLQIVHGLTLLMLVMTKKMDGSTCFLLSCLTVEVEEMGTFRGTRMAKHVILGMLALSFTGVSSSESGSTAFTGIPGYAVALIWLLCGIGYGILLLVRTDCFRTSRKRKNKSSCYEQYHLQPIILASFCTLLAVTASGLALGGNSKSHSRAEKVVEILLDTADGIRNDNSDDNAYTTCRNLSLSTWSFKLSEALSSINSSLLDVNFLLLVAFWDKLLPTNVNENISISYGGIIQICNPFSPTPAHDYQPWNCPNTSVRIGDIPKVIEQIACPDTQTTCNGGILVPADYYNSIGAYCTSIQILLDQFPSIEGLVECRPIKDALSEILNKHCKPLRRYIRLLWSALLFLSVVLVILVPIWTIKEHHDQTHHSSGGSINPHNGGTIESGATNHTGDDSEDGPEQ
ncbi:hypothetical protein SASPL_147907 [Salvia splendens]|uniref:Uncharacterized protein n=1 Tax=Salvia splendens TaxID=180675 RepID=A0A8X8Z724_SALSN|nr:hypothetical protein SASPL_147907 [Salvia splendens]